MGTKRKVRLGTVGERFCFYLDELFAGNQRKAAEYLGCSQAVISKIVLAKQNPGGRVLDLLLQHPKVNPTWLMKGAGDPLLAEPEAGTDQGWPVPVAEALLPGPPNENRIRLTGQVEYVAGCLYRETAYVIVVQDRAIEHVLPGDRILLDADKERWRKNLLVLDGRFCAVQRHVSGGAVIELRRLHCHAEPSGKTVQLRALNSRPPEPEKHPGANKELRAIPLDDLPAGPAGDSQGHATPKPFDVVAVGDVVAIAVELFRRL